MVYVVDSASLLSRRKGGNVGVYALVFLSTPPPEPRSHTHISCHFQHDIANNIGRIHALTISLFIL